jgi:hypothetical protein
VLSDVNEKLTSSRPSVLTRVSAMAQVAAWCPLGYSGWGGVGLRAQPQATGKTVLLRPTVKGCVMGHTANLPARA